MVNYSKIKTLIKKNRYQYSKQSYQFILGISLLLLVITPLAYLLYIEVLIGKVEEVAYFLLILAVGMAFIQIKHD